MSATPTPPSEIPNPGQTTGALPPPASPPEAEIAPPSPLLEGARLLVALAMLAVVVVCLVFAWMTRDSMAQLNFLRAKNAAGEATLVDLHPWQTAQAVAALAVSSEEVVYARDAERLADHEVDQAFAAALRQASLNAPVLSGEALALSQKVAGLQQTLQQDQALLDGLNAAAKSGKNPPAQNDLDVATAQLGLDHDELADAQKELARASGDQRARIQQELAAHEGEMKKYDAQAARPTQTAVASSQNYQTLVERIGAWSAQRSRRALLRQALREAQADAASLAAEHNRMEASATASESAKGSSAAPDSKAEKLASLKRLSEQRQILAIYSDRIETEQQLANTYSKWSAQVSLQRRIVLHLMLTSVALIAFIIMAVLALDAMVRRLLDRPTLDRRRMLTLRTILELSVQLVGVIMVLLVLFGVPRQMPTILGLATAGLTFVMQPFILAFVGWFVLMGKNGIRVGDWVEINGVGGEVAEIGLFRTALLETGNWTDKGHPTGRRVTFINNFAISGQYFNFSTTGQWMWDEIKVSIPSAKDIYATIEGIHKAVLEETDKDARLAESEWKRATRQNNMSQFSAAPAVDMRPAANGIDIIVRYVTRATDRFEMRNRLYGRVISLLEKQPA